MQTMDINSYIEQHAPNLSPSVRQEIIYYIDNAAKNLASSNTKTPLSGNVLGAFGSSNSKDIDLFIHLTEQKDTTFTDIVSKYLQMGIDSIAGGQETRKLDIIFITTHRGQVDWISKGVNVAEINNAIFHTYHNHTLNYDIGENAYRDCPVTSESNMDVGIKALTAVRALISILSKSPNGSTIKRLMFENSFNSRINALKEINEDSGLFSSVEATLHKNQSDESLLKDVAFSFIQLDALLNGTLLPYTKNAVFNTEHTEMLPFVFEMANFNNVYAPQMVKLDEFIIKTLDKVQERITMDEDGNVKLSDDEHAYNVRKECIAYV